MTTDTLLAAMRERCDCKDLDCKLRQTGVKYDFIGRLMKHNQEKTLVVGSFIKKMPTNAVTGSKSC